MKKTILKDETEITKENVKELGEGIAIRAVQFAKRFAYHSLDSLQQGLKHDVYNRHNSENFSAGYDVAQECICFLCNYFGHKLGEICRKTTKGFETIRLACYKTAYHYLRQEKKIYFDFCDLEDAKTVIADSDILKEPQDYTKVNRIIQMLDLNKRELYILQGYYNGRKVQDIADDLHVCKKTVTYHKAKIKQKYINLMNI